VIGKDEIDRRGRSLTGSDGVEGGDSRYDPKYPRDGKVQIRRDFGEGSRKSHIRVLYVYCRQGARVSPAASVINGSDGPRLRIPPGIIEHLLPESRFRLAQFERIGVRKVCHGKRPCR